MAKATLSSLTFKEMKTKLKNIFGENPTSREQTDYNSEIINYTEETYDDYFYNDNEEYTEYENQDYQDQSQNQNHHDQSQHTEEIESNNCENTYMTQKFNSTSQFRPQSRIPQTRQWRPRYQQYSSPSIPRYFPNQSQHQRFNSNPRRFYTQQGISRFNQNNQPRFKTNNKP